MTLSEAPPVPSRKTSGLAITSLVLGILPLSVLTGIPAIICGLIANGEISRDPGLKGKGLATTGIVLGCISFVMIPILGILAGIAVPAISMALERANQTREVSEIRQVGVVLFQYASAHDGRYPDSLKELEDSALVPAADVEKLLYRTDSTEYRWVLTPGLKVTDEENTILLRSAEPVGKGRHKGHAIYTIGNNASWQKD